MIVDASVVVALTLTNEMIGATGVTDSDARPLGSRSLIERPRAAAGAGIPGC
jgi:hypothetical protein